MNPIAAIRKLTGLLAEGERERRYGHDYRQKEAEAQARLETEKLAQVKAKLGIREALAAQDVAGIGDAATLEARGQQGPPNMGDLPPLDPDMAAAAGYDSNAPNLESIRRQAATFKALESKRALEQLKQQGATTRTEITADARRDTANQGHLRPLLRNGQLVGFYNDTTGEFQEGGEGYGQPPTTDTRNKEMARARVGRSIDALQALASRVVTKVGPAQRIEAIKRGAMAAFGSDPEFQTYQDAREALAGNLAVAQQGSRPSDADIKAIWLPLVPDAYRDTTASMAMKWSMIRTMAGQEQGTAAPAAPRPPRPAAPAAPGTPAPAPAPATAEDYLRSIGVQ